MFTAPLGAFAALLGVLLFAGLFPVRLPAAASDPMLAAGRMALPGLAAAVGGGTSADLASRAVPFTIVSPGVTGDSVLGARNTTESARAALQQGNGQNVAGSQQDRVPIFFEHKVQQGETLSGIAAKFGISTRYIAWNNVDIVSDVDALTPGVTLQIPSVEGIIHAVRVGQTVSEIADRYDAKARDIIDFRANGLAGDPNNLREGTLILVPGGRVVPLAVAPKPVATPAPSTAAARPASTPRPSAPAAAPVASSDWVWPGSGPLTSPFGPLHPLGIDIGTGYGAPIVAASSGQVSFAGGNPCCSYGLHVIVQHSGGYETLYAHLSSISVANGQFVTAGTLLGYSGTTGKVTGPHLHFELRRNGVYQDPLQYLP